ncbi:MAG: GAF domain-containing protein [Bacteroidia bacterium]
MNSKENLSELDISQLEKQVAESLEICRDNPQRGVELSDDVLQNPSLVSKKIRFEAIACKGACLVWLGDYENALKNLFDALPYLQDLNDIKFEAHARYHIFCAFYFLADYDNALKYAHEMLAHAEKTGNIEAQANSLNGIGSAYYTSGKNEKAIEALTKGLSVAQKLSDKHLLARIYDGIGTAYFNLKNIEKSVEFKQKSLDEARSIGSKNVESYALDGLAKIYLAANNFKKAEDLFNESLAIREELNFKFGIAEANLQLGELYLLMDLKEIALAHLTVALDIANESQTKEIIYKTHEALSKLYEKQANNEKFIEHFKKYFIYKEEFFSEKNKQKLKGVEMQFSISQMEKEKELLSQKNKQLEALSNDLVVLSDLGKTIISQLTIESINMTVYQIINNMMDAPGFGIGVLSDNATKLTFPGYIENGVVLQSSGYDLADDNRLAPVCFNKEIDIIINDYDVEVGNYLKKRLKPVVGQSVQSIIYLPLKVSDKKIGVITVQSFNKNAFNEYQVNLVKNLAVYCAIAIENATIYEQLEERVIDRTKEVIQQKEAIEKAQENTRLLNVIGQQIISTISFESIFDKLHENVSQLMNADCFSIRIYNEEKQEINYKYSFEKGKLMTPITVSMDNIDNYSVWCVKNKKEIFINDNVNEYHKYTSKIVVPRGEMPSSLLFCPMSIGERITGVITVQSFQKNAYVPSHMDVLRTLGTYTAIALENANLVEHLEEKVKERTSEVVKQKEQVEKSFRNTELIGEIGKEITSTLSVDEIISKVYQKINSLMDATIFGIGVYRSEKEDLYFSGAIEKGKKLDSFSFDLKDEKTATQCFKQCKEFIINDWENEFHKYVAKTYDAVQGEMPESMIYMPLISKGKAIGVITVQSFEKHIYNDYHVDILRSLSVYVGSAIENANLYKGLEERVNERTKEVIKQKEEIERSHENTRLLSEIGQQIISNINFNSIFKKLHENVSQLMNADCFGIRIYHPHLNEIEYRFEIENGEQMQPLSVSMNNDDNFSVWCVKNKKEIFINDNINEHHKYTKKIVVVTGDMPHSLLFCPMMIGERVVGVITVQSFEKNAYVPHHIDVLKTLGTYTAIALENANLVEHLEDKVKERTTEVVKQKEIIEETNKHITDSIKYAKRIQEAFLPSEKSINELLKNAFILYKPKDIVSGDFYWIERKGNKILFAVVDCTGHGVPGAFMSIIGFNGLNQIVNEYNYTRPADILTHLNKSISNTLKQHVDDSKIRDGMDVAICSIDLENNKLEFAGAFSPLFILRNNEVMKFKGDKHPIGNFVGTEEYEFTNNEIDLYPDDRIYIFSDGFVDQFGGPNGKKLKYNYFRKLLLDNHKKPMAKQKEAINTFFEDWRTGFEQIDDVCIIGVAI